MFFRRPGCKPAMLVSLLLALAAAPASQANTGCTKFASPSGSNAASGTEAAPFATAQKLSDSLAPGEVGCLRAGTYNEHLRVGVGGTPTARVTLRSYPGELATVVGRMWIARGADNVTISHMNINGKNPNILPSPTVNAADTVFDNVDVTNDHTAICFNLGSATYGQAVRTIIQNSRIHNCGQLPAANHDHGIYITNGRDIVIRGNVIYANADRGIQLYPDAQRTTITNNIIDGNGQGIIFSGNDGISSNDNVVRNNIITNSKIRHNVESYYPDGTPAGTGNVVTANCISGGARNQTSGGLAPHAGYTATANIQADPQFVNPAAGDYRLAAGSPCAGVLDGQVPTTVASGSTPPTTTTPTTTTPTPAPTQQPATLTPAPANTPPPSAPATQSIPVTPSTPVTPVTEPAASAEPTSPATGDSRPANSQETTGERRVVATAAVVTRPRSCRIARFAASPRVRAQARTRCAAARAAAQRRDRPARKQP